MDSRIADSVIGDLEELRRRRSGSAFRNRLWFWTTALGILFHAVGRRIAAGAAFRSPRSASNGIGGDFCHAVRLLRQHPGFTTTAMLIFALGIGANTTVFSVVRAVLLRPLPYHEPERLVFLWNGLETRQGSSHGVMTGRHVAEVGR